MLSKLVTVLIEGYLVENLSTGDDNWFDPYSFDDACKKLAEVKAAGNVCRLVAEIDA